jgi:transposase
MFVRTKRASGKVYLQIVENCWENGKVRQKVRHSLGRLDLLLESGSLDSILQSLGRYSERLGVIGAHERGETTTATSSYHIGPPLIFERLWREVGIDQVLERLARNRRHAFSLERAVFLTVLHRLFVSGSDRAAEKWKDNYAIEGVQRLELQHLYRTMGWLGEPLPAKEQADATDFGPRSNKDLLEEALFSRRRSLLSSFDIVFFDTTSIYFEGEGGESLGRYGNSKDDRPDCKQIVVGLVLDNEGYPVCSETWPGNTTDVKTLVTVVDRLRRKFHINNICIVADRGMISKEAVQEVTKRGWYYILGARMRQNKEVRLEVLSRPGRYEEVNPLPINSKGPSPLKVKEVLVGQERYVVCINEFQRAKDQADRQAIVEGLEKALRQGDKQLVGNKGFRRYVKTSGERFDLDYDKIKEEERYDGKWVLKTNLSNLSAAEIALKYKQLWLVENIFRTMKTILETRPIYHKCDDTIRGHVCCSFLAVMLRCELENRIAAKGWKFEWADVIRDLDELSEMEVVVSGKHYIIRTPAKGVAGRVFQAVGVQIPAVVRQVEPSTGGGIFATRPGNLP